MKWNLFTAKIGFAFLGTLFIAGKCDFVYFKSQINSNTASYEYSKEFSDSDTVAFNQSAVHYVKEVHITVNGNLQEHTFDRHVNPSPRFFNVFRRNNLDPKKVWFNTAYRYTRPNGKHYLTHYKLQEARFVQGDFNDLHAHRKVVIEFPQSRLNSLRKSYVKREEEIWNKAVRILNFRHFEKFKFAKPTQEDLETTSTGLPRMIINDGVASYTGPTFMSVYRSRISNK